MKYEKSKNSQATSYNGSTYDLTPIDIRNFYTGMYIDSGIFIQINNRYVLLCNDVLLSPALINKLRNAAISKFPILVSKKSYPGILAQSQEFYALSFAEEDNSLPYEYDAHYIHTIQENLAKIEKYSAITEDIKQLLDDVLCKQFISLEKTDTVTGEINSELNNTDTAVIIQCINNIRKMDDYLYSHSTNVAMLNGLLGGWLHLKPYQVKLLIKIGLLHDLGKLKIPLEILNKPAKLTEEEFDIIKLHPVYSHQILIESGVTDAEILSGVKSHHERLNGQGYPDKLKKKQIPLYARITAVSDVYDAMVAKRPYKDRHSPFEILQEFSASRFSDLDIDVVNTLLTHLPNEFMGKKALLSDGRMGIIVSINPKDYAYPIVKIDKEYIKTNKFIRCIAVDDFATVYPH